MKKAGIPGLILVLAALSGCGAGGEIDRSCDDVRLYQTANEGRRIQTPEDLDELNPLREIPMPEASPREARPAGSPCLDLPPRILGTE